MPIVKTLHIFVGTQYLESMLKIGEGFAGERSIILPAMINNTAREDSFLSQLYITAIGYYPHATYHYRERTDPINQYILIYCIKGSGWYEVKGKHYDVRANQVFVIPIGEKHTYASNNEDPWTIYWIHFDGKMASEFTDKMYKPKDIQPGSTSRITDRNTIFEEMFLTLSDKYSVDNLRYTSCLLYGFLVTFIYLNLFRKYRDQNDRINDENIINAALKYMNENLEKQLSLKQLAQYIGYSVSQFSYIFKNNTGHSPLNYFNMMKIQRACQLLETTDMKINQISGKIGIDDSYYFSRMFKKIVGISPLKYRNARKNK